MVGIFAYIIPDKTLLLFCAFLSTVSLSSLSLAYFGKVSFSIHLVLIAYICAFVVASFTHLVSYGLLLIYPIAITFASIYFKNDKIRYGYVAGSILGIFISLVNSHLDVWGEINAYHLLPNIIIASGLILTFVLSFKIHNKRVQIAQATQAENENAIREKNLSMQEYIKTNLQLENFAHLASHDLKTPIKNISNFSQLLDKRMSGILSAKDQELLDMIKEESKRMNGMMSDLLKLSQLSKKKIKYKKINGNKFIADLINENFKLDKGFIAVNSFPMELIVAESHFHILFFNLIENAIKFCGANEDPKITIYGRRAQEHYYFEVTDNGIGIDDKYKKTVFLIFNQLNPSVHAEGTGIGLSMCREIVQRHKGRIWIEDSQEGGSVLKFITSRNLHLDTEDNMFEEDIDLVPLLTA